MPAGMPSWYDLSGTMPALGPNGELIAPPDPYFAEADPSKGTDVLTPGGEWQHYDPHQDRSGNYISPTMFMSNSLPGGFAAAFPDTDEYSHIGRVFRTDRNRSIGKLLALVGGGALAANMAPAAGTGQAGLQTGQGATSITDSFMGSVAPEAVGGGATGTLASAIPAGADVMTVTAPALAGGLGGAGTAGVVGGVTGALSGLGGAGGGDFWTPEGGSGELYETPPNPLEGTTGGGEGMAALPGDVGMTTPATSGGGGILGQIKNLFSGGIHNPDGSINWLNAAKLAGGAASALGSMTNRGGTQTTPTMPAGWNDPAQFQTMTRERTAPMSAADYGTYGTTGGEHKFFTDPVYTRKADGGHVRGPGSGRSDDIDARLSDGEYVMDAETVALLGDGSVDEGSRRLDQLRANLRKHKGAALAKGKFSPAAKDPMHYMGVRRAEGGNVQLGVTELPPVNSNLPAPLPNPTGDYSQQLAELRREMMANQIRKALGANITQRELERLLAGKAKGGRISPQAVDVAARNRELLTRGMERARMRNPISPDMSQLSDLELAQYRRWLEQLKNMSPPEKAKGGRIRGDWVQRVITGGGGRPALEDRLSRLRDTLTSENTLRGAVVDPVAEARQRVQRIQEMMKSTPPPLAKAEGGPVKDLTEFADRLAEQVPSEPVLAE